MGVEGRTTVSNNVFQQIVEFVLRGMDDIVDKKDLPKGFPTNLFRKLTPQAVVTTDDNPDLDFGDVSLELKLTIIYGIKIPDVAANVRKELVKVVEELTGYKVTKIDVVIDKIVSMEELEPAEK